jgi:chromosome partitioning protein
MQLRQTHVVAMANQKGGCGKTTSAVGLAAALAEEGLSVTLVDTDPQCNATDSFGLDRDRLAADGRYTVADAYLAKRAACDLEFSFGERFQDRLHLIPGHKGIGTVSHRLDAQLQAAIANGEYSDLDADDIKSEHRQRLRRSLATLRGVRDLVVIDTPPDLGFLVTTSLIAADGYILPVFPSGYDLKGLQTLLHNVHKVRLRYNQELALLGVLLGNVDSRAKLDADIYGMLIREFGKEFVFETVIARSVKHREATVNGLTICEHAAGQGPAEQYRALAREIIAKLVEEEEEDEQERVQHPERVEANRG